MWKWYLAAAVNLVVVATVGWNMDEGDRLHGLMYAAGWILVFWHPFIVVPGWYWFARTVCMPIQVHLLWEHQRFFRQWQIAIALVLIAVAAISFGLWIASLFQSFTPTSGWMLKLFYLMGRIP